MAKKKIVIISYIALLLVLCSITIYINIDSFKNIFERISSIENLSDIKTWFDLYIESNNNIIEDINNKKDEVIDSVINYLTFNDIKEILGNIFLNIFSFIITFFHYFINIGLNVLLILYICLNESFNCQNLNVKYTKTVKVYFKIKSYLNIILNLILKIFRKIKRMLFDIKIYILITIITILLSNGFIFTLIIEIILFLIVYIIHVLNMEVYKPILSIIKAFIIFIYPHLITLSKFAIVIIITFATLVKAFKSANKRLERNHIRLKRFANEELTQTTFINGPPGVGKTLLNVSLSLASEENIIDELECLLSDYQANYPKVNFAEIRKQTKNCNHQEYIEIFNKLINRKSLLISNYAIYSPYYYDYSKIFDFNFIRKNIPSKVYALEEHTVISLSELDKEYNSHDDMKQLGVDGAATFFSTVSHDLKRTVKIFCDYQLKDQVPLRIRGNSEYFLKVKKRKKQYPFLLYIYYLPFIQADKVVRSLINKYEKRKTKLNKKTKRKGVGSYKRNDYTFIYAILRSIEYKLKKIKEFFNRYSYFKLTCELSEEDQVTKAKKVNLYLNVTDLEIDNTKLYDSTFLSYAYKQKKNTEFSSLDKFTSLTPTTEELNKCNSRFYNKLNEIEEENKTEQVEKQKSYDEFINI